MPPEQLLKLRHYKQVLERMIPYLTVPKERIPRSFDQDTVVVFEKQIVNIVETFKRRRGTVQQQSVQPPQEQAPQQQNGESAAQPHAPGTVQVSNMNPSQQSVVFSMQPSQQSVVISMQPSHQSVVISVQPSAVSPMQQSDVGNQQPQNNVNPLQNCSSSTLQRNALNSLQPSSTTLAHQPSVAKNWQQQSCTKWIRSILPAYSQTILIFLWLLIIVLYFTKLNGSCRTTLSQLDWKVIDRHQRPACYVLRQNRTPPTL